MPNNDPTLASGGSAQLGSRSLFAELQARVYANHAAISPPSDPVAAEVQRWIGDWQRRGALAFSTWAAQRDRLRASFARLIGARADDVALVSNTMHGVNAIALGLPWQRGDRLVVLRGEYPTNVVPWLRAAETFGLQPCWIEASDFAQATIDWSALDRVLAERPRVLAISAVQFQSGLRMPLREISERCHAAGTQVFVDAVQACGAVPIDVARDGIDYLACGSHKWLMGIEGAGLLYVAPTLVTALRPTLTGGMSHQDAFDLLGAGPGHLRYDRPLRSDARVFEGGMLAGASFAALGVSVDLILSLGVDAIYAHTQRYHDLLEPALVARGFASLRPRDPARRSAILSFTPPSHVFAPRLCELLAADGITCSSPDGVLRVSPHWPNGLHEPQLIVDAIDAAVARLPK